MREALLKMHLAVFLWGFTGVLGRAIDLSAPVLVWYRMLITVGILLLVLYLRKERLSIVGKDLRKAIGIGFLFAIHWVAFYASIKYANASIALICLATASVFISLLEPIISKTRLIVGEMLIGIIALSGVFFIYFLQPISGEQQEIMSDFELGVLLGVIAAIISAIFTIFNKPLAEKYKARPLVFIEMLSGLVFLSLLAIPYLFINPGEQIVPQGWDYLWLFILAYCCTVWGQSLAMAALKKLSAFTTTLSVNLEPIYGIILAFIIYHENQQLGWGFYVGMFLILFSLGLQTVRTFFLKKRAKKLY